MTASTGCSHDGDPPRDGGPLEAAHFMRGSIAELSQMAHRHGHGTLAYLLDMALMEAEEIMRLGRTAGRSGH
jgi:hypothetical protein